MKLTIESTDQIVTVVDEKTRHSIPARVWEGKTESGIRCFLYVTRIMVHEDDDNSQFERELQEHRKPSFEFGAIPLRMII
jgi:hypothetical protein